MRTILLFCAIALQLAVHAAGSAIQDTTFLREKRRAESEDSVLVSGKKLFTTYTTFKTAIDKMPPKLKEAFRNQDFSKITPDDLRQLDASTIELIPRQFIEKMNMDLVSTLVGMLVDKERPTGLSRIVDYAGERLKPEFLLDQIKGNDIDENDETKRVLLYMAMEKLSDSGMVDREVVRNLQSKGLLESVLPSQLVGVKDDGTARTLLENLFGQGVREGKVHHNELEEKALLTKLSETAYGPVETWTSQNVVHLSKQLPSMASQFIKGVPDKAIADAMNHVKESDIRNPQLGMTLAKQYISNHYNVSTLDKMLPANINGIIGNLGQVGAFLPMDMVRNMQPATRLVALYEMTGKLEEIQQAVPVEVRKEVINLKLDGKPLEQLNLEYSKELGVSLLAVAAPALINKLKDWNLFDTAKLSSIAQLANDALGQGLINQVAPLAIEQFTRHGSRKVNLATIPAPYLGSVPLEKLKNLDGHDVNNAVANLRLVPDDLSDPQKGMMMGLLRDSGLLQSMASHLPPQMKAFIPASLIPDHGAADILHGLPASSPQRMHFALEKLNRTDNRPLTPRDLEEQPDLLSVLTPEDISRFNPEDIPALMLAVKNAKEGPSTQVLWALRDRLYTYLRRKSSNPDATPTQLLKQMSQAEFVNLPGSVLALFDKDALTDSKVAADKKREILTSLGDLRKTDYLEVPRSQREAIIEEGLKALEAMGKAKEVGVEKLTALGNSVQDLPASAIRQLTPVALEQVLPVLQGTDNDDNDDDQQNGRLRLKACLKPDQREALESKILEVFGAPKWWDGNTMSFLCCSIDILSASTLGKIRPDVILDCHCEADQEPPSHLKELKEAAQTNCGRELNVMDQLEKDFAKVEEKRAEAAMALADQIVLSRRRRRRSSWGKSHLTCEAVRLATSGATFSASQLDSMDPEEVSLCLYELGKKPLCEKRSSILWEKLLQFYKGNVSNIPPEVLSNVGWVARGIQPDHALDLPFDKNLDVLAAFGQDHMYTQEQLHALAVRVKRTKGTPGVDYSTDTLIYLNNILCGFTKGDVDRFKPSYFLYASPVLRSIRSCKADVLSGLAILAKGDGAFGPPHKWTAAQVRALGTVFAGLSQTDIDSVRPRAIRGITPSAVRNMPDDIFKELNSEQVKNFPREAAQAVSESQLQQLKSDDHQVMILLADGSVTSAAASLASFSLISLSILLAAITKISLLDS